MLALFSLWNYAGLKTDFKPHQGGHLYTQMVNGESVPSLYCYRILTPSLSFGSMALAYFLMAIGLALTGWGLFILTGYLGGDQFAQWAALLLFMLW